MSHLEIDELAKEKVLKSWGMPPCLHIPIAARDENAIQRFIGKIVKILSPGKPNNALLVHCPEAPELNLRLPIWQLNESAIFHKSEQVWVHVNYTGYRKAYSRAFPNEDVTNMVLDHIMNRRVARLKGFHYLRIVPISRVANSCSGGMTEKMGVEYHRSPNMVKKNKEDLSFIQYADLADVVKMLNLKTGGLIQDGVREAIRLIEEA